MSLPNLTTRRALTTLSALALAGGAVGSLAGCAAGAAPADSGTDSGSGATDGGGSSAGGSYRDGNYTADGVYQSPGGTESIEVTVTLAGGIVTAVEVTGLKASPSAVRYQEEFSAGIADIVVGKKIDELNVTRVAGSSLTSAGFNDAIVAIKADALG